MIIGCAISEELLFRGVLYTLLSEGLVIYAVCSTATFVVWHHLTPWSKGYQNRKEILEQIVFSLIFCLSVIITEGVLSAVILHVVYNAGTGIKDIINIKQRGVTCEIS